MSRIRSSQKFMWAASAVAVLVAAAGCSDDPKPDQSGVSAVPDSATGSSGNSAALPLLDELHAGYDSEPPSDSPPPASGKSVYWISCGQVAPDCAVKAAEGEKAARAMGWDFHLVDGNFGFAGAYAAGIRTAIAASPDAIVTDAFPCTDVQQPLQEAKDAGILVLGMESTDCSDVGGPKLYTAPMSANSTEDTEAKYFEGFGKYSADYIIAASDGKAKIINSPGQNSQQQLLNDAFVAEIDKCAGCEIVADVKWSTEDFKPNGAWTQGFRSAVIQHPEATAVYAPFDSMAASFGGSQAIVEAGRDICSGTPPYPSDCVIAVGGIGTNETLDLVRDGKWTALGSARDHEWMAWGVVDNLNRAFNGEPPAPEGIGFTAVDKSSGLPSKAGEHFHSQIDFRAAYLAAWGVG